MSRARYVDPTITHANTPSTGDTGAGTDAGESIAATASSADTGTGTDAESVNTTPTAKVGADTIQFAETTSVFIAGSEPAFSRMEYDMGWKDVVNILNISVPIRVPNPTSSQILDNGGDFFNMLDGETRTFTLHSADPFYNAITPVQDKDFTLTSGSSPVTVSISRESGQSLTVSFRPSGGPATVQGFVVRGTLVPVARTLVVTVSDAESISAVGEKSVDLELPWAGVNDALGIASMIIGKRAIRRPLIKVTLNNQTNERLAAIFQRAISDQIHIIEPRTFTNDEYYIDSIAHSVSNAGLYHEATFTCEKQILQVTNVFTFDDPARGFNDGLFGRTGIDQTDTVFRLDVSNLDERLLAY